MIQKRVKFFLTLFTIVVLSIFALRSSFFVKTALATCVNGNNINYRDECDCFEYCDNLSFGGEFVQSQGLSCSSNGCDGHYYGCDSACTGTSSGGHTCSDVLDQNPDPPTVERTSPTEANISWQTTNDPDVIRLSLIVALQSAGIGPSLTMANGGTCNPPTCPVFERNIDPHITGYWHATGLAPGTFYNVFIKFYAEDAPPPAWKSLCTAGAATKYLSSCTLSPDPLNLSGPGATGLMSTYLAEGVGRIVYNSSANAIATVTSPDIFFQFPDPAYAYTTTVSGVSNGSVVNSGKKCP